MDETIINVSVEGDENCSHKMEPERTYDLPDPDIRNPIRVKHCRFCERETHHGTPVGEEPIDKEYYE